MSNSGRARTPFPHDALADMLGVRRRVGVCAPQRGRRNWGASLPAGVAQGIAVHTEYKGVAACLVEIDCRPETVNRPIREGVTGPRVTR